MAGSANSDSSTSATPTITRTLAIIKAHAIKNRFDIESRISSSGFEIVKERQLGFHEDDSGVRELFGHNVAPSLCGEPVWIYILERRRAVEVWKSLMGDEDPELARISAPDSLRALYGISSQENAVYGSPDAVMAELQINSIFASSPPFPPTYTGGDEDVPENLDADANQHGSQISHTSSVSTASNSTSSPRVDVKSKTGGFKARAVPASHAVPTIEPRMSRAAALRAGIDLPARRRSVATQESIAKTFENVPGHKRALTVNVASTAPPVIAPRQTRASALRTGAEQPSPKGGPPVRSVPRKAPSPERLQEIFADVPGHKRRESIRVASTAPPKVAPRPTKASALRTGEGSPPKAKSSGKSARPSTAPSPTRKPPVVKSPAAAAPSTPTSAASSRDLPPEPEAAVLEVSPERKPVSFEGVPGHKRSSTIEVMSTRPPSTTPRINRSAALRLAHKDGPSAAPPSSFFMKSPQPPTLSRSSSRTSIRQSTTSASARSESVEPGARPPSATPRPPSITPRTNKAALLRAQTGTPVKKVFAF